jgi:hypothetical protein
MTATFKEIRKLQGERVRMYFDDGREVVALLLCATKDIDGSKHLIYDQVESASLGEAATGTAGCSYADAKALVKIEHADAKNRVSGPRGLDRFATRSPFEEEWLKTFRPSA